MTVRNVKKNLAGQQDLLPGVGPYEQVRRGAPVTVDGPAKSYIELWRRTIVDTGLVYSGTFEDGCSAVTNSCVVSLTAGKAYIWRGVSTNVIPKDSSPQSTGGIGPTAWEDLGNNSVYSRILAELGSPTGVDLVGGAAKQADLAALNASIANVAFDNSIETTFAQKVRLGQSDCYVLVQGDSTGDSDTEWVRLTAGNIATKYPTHTVKYVMWDHPNTTWAAPVTVSVGTGTKTIWFYNGSRPGAVAGYWTGNRFIYAFNGLEFDVIFTNFGLNVPTSINAQQEQHAEHLFTLRNAQPRADLISCIQPIDYSLLDRNPVRAEGQKLVNKLYGIRTVDVMRKFLDLVASTGGDYTPWYIDSLHPSAAGSIEWAKLTTSALLTVKGDSATLATRAKANSGFPNGMFKQFLSGPSTIPDFWLSDSTVLKDQSFFETFGQAVRVSGLGVATGTLFVENANELMQRYMHLPQIVIAARLRSATSGVGSGKCGKVFFAHSINTAYTEVQSTQGVYGDINDNFRWVFLLVNKSFWQGKTDFRIGVFSGQTGEFVSIDRILISPTLAVDDCEEQDYLYEFTKTDTSHVVPANSRTRRLFTHTTPVAIRPGMQFEVALYPSIANLAISASCNVAGSLDLFYTNYSASDLTVPAGTLKFKQSI